jgi:hypothetical protein
MLLREVESKMKMTGPSTQPAGGDAGTGGVRNELLLSDEDIYEIRLAELRPDETVQVTFRNNVVERFIKAMRGRWIGDLQDDPNAADKFRGWSNVQKTQYIVNLSGEDTTFTKDIQIMSDPRFIIEFRNLVWPRVGTTCGQAACHGGPEGKGGFKLFVGTGKNPRVDYTNFYIMDRLATGRGDLFDRSSPDDSLLLQYGLQADQSAERHPGGRFTAIYANVQSRNYQVVRDWISTLAGPPHPPYHVKYVAPFNMKMQKGSGVRLPPVDEPASKPAVPS